MSIQVNLSIKEIYSVLCEDCKKRLELLVKEKMDQSLVKKMLEGD